MAKKSSKCYNYMKHDSANKLILREGKVICDIGCCGKLLTCTSSVISLHLKRMHHINISKQCTKSTAITAPTATITDGTTSSPPTVHSHSQSPLHSELSASFPKADSQQQHHSTSPDPHSSHPHSSHVYPSSDSCPSTIHHISHDTLCKFVFKYSLPSCVFTDPIFDLGSSSLSGVSSLDSSSVDSSCSNFRTRTGTGTGTKIRTGAGLGAGVGARAGAGLEKCSCPSVPLSLLQQSLSTSHEDPLLKLKQQYRLCESHIGTKYPMAVRSWQTNFEYKYRIAHADSSQHRVVGCKRREEEEGEEEGGEEVEVSSVDDNQSCSSS
ncbi:hypothetical protein ADUPG1_008335, partial [Aduncisulcus paluster]